MEVLNENTIRLIMLIVAPGFISLKIWGLIHPSPKLLLSAESLIEVIIFSCFNYISTIWLYLLLKETPFVWVYYLTVLLISFLWPILLKSILNIRLLKKIKISLIPKSWDYFFSKRELCFMLIHLNNGKMIGGLYGMDSFASSYPEKEDLYLQEVWKIDSEGKFIEKILGSKGLLVNHSLIEYIELFDVTVTEGGNNE